MKILSILITLIGIFSFLSCNKNLKNADKNFSPLFTPGPRAYVYKTNADYSNKVPVILSEDKKTIISYPHPNDVKTGNSFLTPTKLLQDYYLDNKGIQINTAFLDISFEEYSSYTEVPPLSYLESKILDKNPFTELCDCGLKSNIKNTETIDLLIKQKKLRSTCKVLK
ncbi:MAG: hypothetical protein H6578_09620 [Chitinophagales bacterium]|nr:hypothetical protein [Chitinophagales bacterium]